MKGPFAEWRDLAGYWDEKQGDAGDLWHRELINPTVLRVLGPVDGQAVLDLACGNGALSRQVARAGARIVGVDASPPVIAEARRREAAEPLGIAYHVGDASALHMLEEGTFDAVICNMALDDIADARGAIRETHRVLKRGGRLVISIGHPCFEIGDATAWVVERVGPVATLWRKVSRYRAVFEYPTVWRKDGTTLAHTRSYHRPLPWYFDAFRDAGFAVTALEEPEPTEGFRRQDMEGPWIAEIPLQCVFEARKFNQVSEGGQGWPLTPSL